MNAWNDPKYLAPENVRTDVGQVEHLVLQRHPKWVKKPHLYNKTLDHYLRGWAFDVWQLFEAVDPKLSCDEFEHTVSKRSVLDEFLQVAQNEKKVDLLDWLIPLVDEIDERFRNNTTPDKYGYIANPNRSKPAYWFLRRLPNHPNILEMYRQIGPAENRSID